jgi:MSHA biogenesis protein MshJ
MNRRLKALARRVNTLSLRERVFLFLSAAIVVVAVADTLVISPQLALQRERAALLARQNTELTQLRAQLASATAPAGADSPIARLQAAVQASHQERLRLAVESGTAQAPDVGTAQGGPAPARLADLLPRVLRRHEGLSLVRLAVVPASSGSAAPSPVPNAGTAPARLDVQAVDLVLAGPYLALAAYLAEIEATLPGLRWGPVRLEGSGEAEAAAGTAGPKLATLTLQLWLPSEVR